MEDFIQLIVDPLMKVYVMFVAFIPNILAMLIIIIMGTITAWLVRIILSKLLKILLFDSWCDRIGLTAAIRKWNHWGNPSSVFVSIIFWFMIIVAVMSGLSALKINSIDNLVHQFVLYIPRMISAFLIFAIGYYVTGFMTNALLQSAMNKGYYFSRMLSEVLRFFLIVLFLSMALEQLQVAPGIVFAAFSIIFGGGVLALAIAFGVGGITLAKKILERTQLASGKKKDNNG